MTNKNRLPQHIAIIMDGNRRWARENKLQMIAGHRKAAEDRIDELVDYCIKKEIPYLTLWAFSTENWNRPKNEVKGIMNLLREALETSLKKLHEKGVKFNTIGELSRFDQDIQDQLEFWKKETKNNTAITVTFALNYGGRDEIVRAVKKLLKEKAGQGKAAELKAELKEVAAEISEPEIEKFLDTSNLPDPDLIIRPGREKRLSGFLTWQNVYSELYFSDVLMPDFGAEELEKALDEFARRKRRFGR